MLASWEDHGIGYLTPKEFQKYYSHGIRVPRQRDFKWKPPTAAMMWKTNFDRAMFSESDQAGIGVVVRNQVGQVMAA